MRTVDTEQARQYARLVPRSDPPSKLKRLTIDLSPEMHRSLKIGAAANDVQMVDLVRYLVGDLLADPKRLQQVAEKARDSGR